MGERLFWCWAKIIYGTERATWVGVLVKLSYPAIKPQYIIVKFEEESSIYKYMEVFKDPDLKHK